MLIKQVIKDLQKQLMAAKTQRDWITENLERLEEELGEQTQKIEDIERDIKRMEPLRDSIYNPER